MRRVRKSNKTKQEIVTRWVPVPEDASDPVDYVIVYGIRIPAGTVIQYRANGPVFGYDNGQGRYYINGELGCNHYGFMRCTLRNGHGGPHIALDVPRWPYWFNDSQESEGYAQDAITDNEFASIIELEDWEEF